MIAHQLRHGMLFTPQNNSERAVRSSVWLDAAVGSYAFAALILVIKTLQHIAIDRCSPELHLEMPAHMLALFSSVLPPFDLLTFILAWLIFGLMAIAILASLWRRYLNNTIRSVIFITIVGIVLGVSSWYWQECVIGTVSIIAMIFAAWWFVTRIFRLNAISYVFVLVEIFAGMYLGELIDHGKTIGLVEMIMASVFVCLPFVATGFVLLKDKQVKSESKS